jgi:hypothetical protein
VNNTDRPDEHGRNPKVFDSHQHIVAAGLQPTQAEDAGLTVPPGKGIAIRWSL